MPLRLGTEVPVGPGDIVVDGEPSSPPQKKGGTVPPQFSAHVCCGRTNDRMDQNATWYGGRPRPRRHVLDWDPSSPHKGITADHITFRPMYCGQTTGWIKMPLGTEVGLGPERTVLDGDPAPQKGSQQPPPPLFGPCIGVKRLGVSRCHLVYEVCMALATMC